MEADVWIQTAAVVVASAGVVAALVIGIWDRRAAEDRARRDRELQRKLAEHQFRTSLLLRLASNVNDPGHTDRKESRQLAAERAALLHSLGPEGLPLTWKTFVGPSPQESHTTAANESVPEWRRCQAEVAVLVSKAREAWEDIDKD